MAGGQGVARKIDLGIALAPAHIPVAALHQLNGGTGTEIGAADADDDEHIACGADPVGGRLYALHLAGFFGGGQGQPAKVVASFAGTLREGHMGLCDFLFNTQ